jgi:putative C-S lyase
MKRSETVKHDFDTFINRRGTGSFKWMPIETIENKDVIPFSVAEMEFRTAPAVIEALKRVADMGTLGYMGEPKGYFEAVSGWMKNRHDYTVKKEWLVKTPGVVPAIQIAIRSFTKQGEGVIIQPPVYYPFKMTTENNNRRVVLNPLQCVNGRYEMDFKDLEIKAADPNNKLFILCSPHNPVGRVWTKEELKELGRICNQHGVLVVSDEIHFDLVFKPFKHTVYATLGEEFAQNSVILTAPSKSFNICGLGTSNIFISNPDLWERFMHMARSQFLYHTSFGMEGCLAAYRYGEEWLDQAIAYIDENRKAFADFFKVNFPSIKVFDLEATYLQWADFNSWGMDTKALESFMKKEAHLFLDEGYVFGEEGNGFERFAIACPRHLLMKGLERLKAAAQKRGIEK